MIPRPALPALSTTFPMTHASITALNLSAASAGRNAQACSLNFLLHCAAKGVATNDRVEFFSGMMYRQTGLSNQAGFFRRGVREVEGDRLEICCTARYPGFESLPLRHTAIRRSPVKHKSHEQSWLLIFGELDRASYPPTGHHALHRGSPCYAGTAPAQQGHRRSVIFTLVVNHTTFITPAVAKRHYPCISPPDTPTDSI